MPIRTVRTRVQPLRRCRFAAQEYFSYTKFALCVAAAEHAAYGLFDVSAWEGAAFDPFPSLRDQAHRPLPARALRGTAKADGEGRRPPPLHSAAAAAGRARGSVQCEGVCRSCARRCGR